MLQFSGKVGQGEERGISVQQVDEYFFQRDNKTHNVVRCNNLFVVTNEPQEPEYIAATNMVGDSGFFTEDYSWADVLFEETTGITKLTRDTIVTNADFT